MNTLYENFKQAASDGYAGWVQRDDGTTLAIMRYYTTLGVILNPCPTGGYQGRWCFRDATDALTALLEWDGKGHPEGLWERGHLDGQKYLLFDGKPLEVEDGGYYPDSDVFQRDAKL